MESESGRAQAAGPPPVVVLMGVSGSGKSTVGALLADRLGWDFADGDSFHSAANVAKMTAHQPLTDADRWPWLAEIGGWIDRQALARRPGVVACSALKRTYRDVLRSGRPQARFVYLEVDPDTLRRRIGQRVGHMFPADMLIGQLAAWEPSSPEEGVVNINADGTVRQTVDSLIEIEHLQAFPAPRDDGGTTPGRRV